LPFDLRFPGKGLVPHARPGEWKRAPRITLLYAANSIHRADAAIFGRANLPYQQPQAMLSPAEKAAETQSDLRIFAIISQWKS
jgi:hypothetical protein